VAGFGPPLRVGAEAGDGRETVEAVRLTRADVVLMDIKSGLVQPGAA
jgi:DNA-binding NarL/FixJ family response regulator